MDIWMDETIDFATHNVQREKPPLGAVLTIDKEIVSEAVNEHHERYDGSSNEQLVVIRKAQAVVQMYDLLNDESVNERPHSKRLTSMYISNETGMNDSESEDDTMEVGIHMPLLLNEVMLKQRENNIHQTQSLQQDGLENNKNDRKYGNEYGK